MEISFPKELESLKIHKDELDGILVPISEFLT